METIIKIIARLYADGHQSSAQITRDLLDELAVMEPATARVLLEPVIQEFVMAERRRLAGRSMDMKRIEVKRARAGDAIRVHRRAAAISMDFMDCMVPTESGPKKWRDLSKQDHLRRMVIHESNRAAADWSLRSHEWALEALTRHHANALRDISPGTLAGELPDEGIRP
jgi:hypothetical protein